MSSTTKKAVLVVGATGHTGKYVVTNLLNAGCAVKALARSRTKLDEALVTTTTAKTTIDKSLLTIIEASILDMNQTELDQAVEGCDSIVCCLGHTLDWKGVMGRSCSRLVTDSVQRLTTALTKTKTKKKFVLMGSDGVAFPGDTPRGRGERFVLWMLRKLITPHVDNEQAAAYLQTSCSNNSNSSQLEWSIVRPTDLIHAEDNNRIPSYDVAESPITSLFGGGRVATRATVATFMSDLITDDDVSLWNKWKFKAPVLYDEKVGSNNKKVD